MASGCEREIRPGPEKIWSESEIFWIFRLQRYRADAVNSTLLR
jgi:hypothetical protein